MASLGKFLGDSGRKQDARKIIEELKRRSTHRYISPCLVALVQIELGERDQAIASLEQTELFRANNPKGGEEEARYLSRVPMGRFAQPGDIAAAIAFLASEQAAFITGQTLFVDGGASLGSL